MFSVYLTLMTMFLYRKTFYYPPYVRRGEYWGPTGLDQYDSLGGYCGPHTASSVFLILLPLYKGGNVLAMLKGGHKKFWSSFYAVT